MDEPFMAALTELAAQLPIVAILLYIFSKQTDAHRESVEHYRKQIEKQHNTIVKITEILLGRNLDSDL